MNGVISSSCWRPPGLHRFLLTRRKRRRSSMAPAAFPNSAPTLPLDDWLRPARPAHTDDKVAYSAAVRTMAVSCSI